MDTELKHGKRCADSLAEFFRCDDIVDMTALGSFQGRSVTSRPCVCGFFMLGFVLDFIKEGNGACGSERGDLCAVERECKTACESLGAHDGVSGTVCVAENDGDRIAAGAGVGDRKI